ncbi:hypothetical protein [Kitasatospora sp. NPDC056181]|uniref:hypothetical protein n=1 Tax=Kitasatospora sp. NPDC056181 TaxID=3345737 RepID=UPI0035DA1576
MVLKDRRLGPAANFLWSKCPHDYKVRYRNAAGKQTEETGFATQDKAIDRLTEIYRAKRERPQSRRSCTTGGSASSSRRPTSTSPMAW